MTTDIESGRRLLAEFAKLKWCVHTTMGKEGFYLNPEGGYLCEDYRWQPHSDLNHMAMVEAEIGRRGKKWKKVYGARIVSYLDQQNQPEGIWITQYPGIFKIATVPPMARFTAAVETVKELGND